MTKEELLMKYCPEAYDTTNQKLFGAFVTDVKDAMDEYASQQPVSGVSRETVEKMLEALKEIKSLTNGFMIQ